MAAITELTSSDLQRLLARYDLGTLVRYWPAGLGIENTNYFVEMAQPAGSARYVVTLLEQPANAGALLVELLDVIGGAGLPVAPVVRNRRGEAQDVINDKPALIAPCLPGRHVVNPTMHHCVAVGTFLARFHRASAPLIGRAADYPRGADWARTTAAAIRGYLPYADRTLLDQCITATVSMLARTDVSLLPRGIIHGDLFRDNVLFTEHGLSGVLDFHHAAQGTWLYDLAVAINDWCTDGSGALDQERATGLLRAYNQVRPLMQQELWWISGFALYAAVAFWLSRLFSVCNSSDSAAELKNPEEFRRIASQHLAHSLYLDWRRIEPLPRS
jgi:homoserine kinase type II